MLLQPAFTVDEYVERLLLENHGKKDRSIRDSSDPASERIHSGDSGRAGHDGIRFYIATMLKPP